MPQSDAELIRTSFAAIATQTDRVVDRFYESLFATAPQVRSLFSDDMSQQKRHLLAAVGLVVKHAHDLTPLTSALRDMGWRHAGYGAQEAHYPVVRDVMLQTLAEVAGDAWTDEFHAAWERALNAVAGTMIEGAQKAAA